MKKILALSALLLGTALAGPGNNTLVIGASQETANLLDPWATNNQAISAEINNWMQASLVALNNEGELWADLATEVPTEANGGYKEVRKDGKVVSNSLTFNIRKNANWSDGKPITTGDFEFWLKVRNDERVPVPDRHPFDKAKITKVSDKKFTITFNPPYLFAKMGGIPSLAPQHVMKDGWAAFDKATKGQKPGEAVHEEWKKFIGKYTSSSNLPKVVSGPFKPKSWRPGNSLTMVRNTKYHRTPKGGFDKYLKSVTYRFITNTNTLQVNILSGSIDALATVGISFDQGLDLAKKSRGKFDTHFVPGAIWEHIDINSRGKKAKELDLGDAKVRKGLLLAIDREALVKALYQGKQPVSNTFVHPLASVYNKNVQKYKCDPAAAKKMFAEAGWKPGSDGILRKNGKKFEIRFGTTAGNTVREKVQQILQAQWKKVGVKVKIQNYPAQVFFGPDMLSKGESGKWDMAMFAWIANPIFEEGDLFKSEGIPSKSNGYAGQNYSAWKNAEYDKLHKASQTEFNTAKRAKNFVKMQDIWGAEIPALPLYFRSNPYTVAKGLVNYDFSAYTQYPTWDAATVGWAKKGAVELHKQK